MFTIGIARWLEQGTDEIKAAKLVAFMAATLDMLESWRSNYLSLKRCIHN
jgi:hypothetical protein